MTSGFPYRDVMYEALAGSQLAVRDTSPHLSLLRLTQQGASAATADAAAIELIQALAEVAAETGMDAAADLAARRFETPERFRDAIYFARCLVRDPAPALALLAGRRYLEGAATPAAFPDLHTDRAAVLDATTFESLWREPARADWSQNALALWRRDYVTAYTGQHASYNRAIATISETVDGLRPQAEAIERLNGLPRLGPAVAAAALTEFHEIERLFACALDAGALTSTLTAAPLCPECAYTLGDAAPVADARRVRQAIERGLAGQQARLAQRVVSRLLSRPLAGEEARLARFIEVVQASDLAGLAHVLDDALVDFLRGLLEAPDAEDDVLRRLAAAYPEVTDANLDAAVAEFRRLLQDDIARGGGHLRLSREPGA